ARSHPPQGWPAAGNAPASGAYGTPLIPGCWPGGTFGAGVACTGGVNRFPPVGLMLFSPGAGGAPAPVGVVVGVVVVVVVVVVVSGAFSSLAHAAVIAPIAMMAERPATAASRRPKRCGAMV